MASGAMETVTLGNGHLDTVRTLHQTVVSLRTALELSKNELQQLKAKYEQHSHCIDYADVIEKLTLENHILRRKIIDSGSDEKDLNSKNIKLQVTYSPRNDINNTEVVIRTSTPNLELSEDIIISEKNSNLEENNNFELEKSNINEEDPDCSEVNGSDHNSVNEVQLEQTYSDQTVSKPNSVDNQTSYKTKLELLSKFDVRIKVRTVKEGTILSSTTSESDSCEDKEKHQEKQEVFAFKEKREHFDNLEDNQGHKINFKTISSENIKMAVPNEEEVKSKVDKFDVQVRITSEENLEIQENVEKRDRRKDTLNLDVDDLSLRSISEGDNSVFSESAATPADPEVPTNEEKNDDASSNESEEVDDIELIFTTDESKDMSNFHEDMVSIQETDQWVPTSASTHSTPVLIKFHTLDPDFQPTETIDIEQKLKTSSPNILAETTLKQKRVSLPNDKEIRHVAFTTKSSLDLPSRGILKSDKSDSLFKRSPNVSSKKIDSVDSLSCDYTRGLSLDTKSSSFELGSSMDILTRNDSIDSFYKTAHLGHRFSVFAETDISKCGISEEDLGQNMYFRRNTCPNPFQFRPMPRAPRTSGPFKPSSRIRPVLRETMHPRKENGAQTDVSALPQRWTSDGYLAYKLATPPMIPTIPQRSTLTPTSRLTIPARENRPALSDIGFTSMVPELSRSADPVWALAKRPPSVSSGSTAKYMSRGSFRSPSLSVDRSNEWFQPSYTHSNKMDYRSWRSSLPDVRRDDTDELLEEADVFVRRSTENIRAASMDASEHRTGPLGTPYIPLEPRQLRLGHSVKLITPMGRVAVGRVRYVGLAGGTAATSAIVVGAEFLHRQYPGFSLNDGTHHGRRYFLASPHCVALFVPFHKVVMAWAT